MLLNLCPKKSACQLIRRTGLHILFLLIPFTGIAQDLSLRGFAEEYFGQTISISIYEDYITGTLNEVSSAIINGNGTFQLTLDLETTQKLLLSIGSDEGSIVVEPGKTYNLNIKQQKSNTNSMAVSIAESKRGEINFDINAFEVGFAELTASHYNLITRGKKRKRLDSLFENYGSEHKMAGNTYLNTHIDYKIAMIKMMTHKSNVGALEKELLVDKPVKENNEAYMNFVNQYFANYFLSISMGPGGDKVLQMVNKNKDYTALMDYLGNNKGLQNMQLRELILLKGLYEVYRNSFYEKKMITDLLDTIKVKTQFPNHRTLASNIKASLTRLDKGAMAPDFILRDADKVTHKLSDYRGKYVYLDFWATWCLPCLHEMKVLPLLVEKYGEHVTFISISLDKDFDKMRTFLEKNKKLDPNNPNSEVFLYCGDSKKVQSDYNIKSIPSYFLIDKEGKFVKSPAERPSGNIEKTFGTLFQLKKKEPSISDPGE